MNMPTVLRTLLGAGLLFALLTTAVHAQNDTPASDTAALFEPCAFEVGSDAGPLEDTAPKQGYSYTRFADEAATLGQFARLLRTTGLLYISTHGSPRGVVIECYPGTGSGRRARDAAFTDYVSGTNLTGNNPDSLTLAADVCIQKIKGARSGRRYWIAGPQDRTYHGIWLRDRCIQQLSSGATNAPLIFAASCNSWGLRDDFLNAREFFGYDAVCRGTQTTADSRLLYQRMDGRGAPQGLLRPAHGSPAARPDGSQTAFGQGGFTNALMHNGPGNTTLAPTVNINLDGAFFPQDSVTTNTTVPGRVIFDTNMATDVPPDFVIKVTGDCTAALRNIRWTGTTQLDFDVDVGPTEGTLTFIVNNRSALSANNLVNLDGNQDPKGLSGVAPNQDDFQWTVACQTPNRAQNHASAPDPAVQLLPATTHSATNTLLAPRQSLTGTTVVESDLLLIAEPGQRAHVVFQLENLGRQADVLFFAMSDLTSTNARIGTATLPRSTISATAATFAPQVVLLEPEMRTPMILSVDAPSGQPSGLYTGTVTVTVSGADAQLLPVQLIINQTPTLTTPLTQTVRAGQTLTMTISASDLDQEPILLHAEALPDGALEENSNFVDNGDGTATFTFMPDASMAGVTVSVPLIASNIYPFDPDQLDSLAFPPFVPHNAQALEISVLRQESVYLPLILK